MDILHAKELLTILADGVNPMTGEVLPQEDSCNQVEIVRALHAVLSAIPEPKAIDAKQKNKPVNAGKPWTKTEESEMVKEFDAGYPVSRIANVHGRSRGAIEGRLVKLGKLTKEFPQRWK